MNRRIALSITCAALLLLPKLSAAQTGLADEQQINSVEERRILVSIDQEYEKLAEREADLDGREMELKTLANEVDKKLVRMQELRDELTKLLSRKKAKEDQRVAELSQIYEKMEPNNAAKLLKKLDKSLAIELLIGIKKKTAGKILDNLDTETATALSKAFTNIPVKGNNRD